MGTQIAPSATLGHLLAELHLQTLASSLPITALAWLSSSLLLSGSGPCLRLYECAAGKETEVHPPWQVLHWNRIHCLVKDDSNTPNIEILVCGGKEVTLVQLDIDNCNKIHRLHYWRAPDWILTAAFTSTVRLCNPIFFAPS